MADDQKEIVFRIRRYKPALVDPPRFQSFSLTVHKHTTVLDGLEQLALDRRPEQEIPQP